MKPRVCVVCKRSSWRKWVEEENDARVTALLDANDEVVGRLRLAHQEHVETIEEVRKVLTDLEAVATWHDWAAGFHVDGACDLIITVGGDGTLLAASHGIGPGMPLLGVNSAPNHSVGFFCSAKKGAVREALALALAGKLPGAELTRMCVELNDRVLHQRVLNEALFCHASPAATSRYILRLVRRSTRTPAGPLEVLAQEPQKSSGVLVGPAAGSTAAQQSAGGHVLPLASRKLQYVVREPYRPRAEEMRLTLGQVEEGEAIVLKSQMREARVFLDGDRIVHDVGIGDVVTMFRSKESLLVLGLPLHASA